MILIQENETSKFENKNNKTHITSFHHIIHHQVKYKSKLRIKKAQVQYLGGEKR
jgi:hypothetical protein